MARPKKAKKVRSRIKSADEVHLGPEPIFTKEPSKIELIRAYNWYNYMKTSDHAKKFVVAWMKQQEYDKKLITKFNKVNEKTMPLSLGWKCRILMNGGVFSDEVMSKLALSIERITASVQESVPEVKTEETKPVISIQKRIQERVNDLVADLEVTYDQEDWEFDVTNWLIENDVKPQLCQKIADRYKNLYSELYEALYTKDPDLKEGYKPYKKKELKQQLEFTKRIIAEAEKRANALKVSRKPRKKKVKPAADQVKSLKYQEKDGDLVSEPPVKIIGATQLWVYNTKYRTLSVFNAMGPAGLGVKGTTLTGFDPKTSITKKLRKPDEVLKRVLEGGKIVLRKLMDELTTKPSEANGRINNNTILVRVVK